VLAVEDLVKRFGDIRAVDAVNFTVSKGDVLAFLGPNGAGKSTTMKIITGYLQADSGRVTYDGADIAEQPRPIKSRIGYLPEGVPMYGEMPVHSFLAFIAKVRRMPSSESRRRISKAVSALGLHGVLTQRIETLSKGYQRRVGLAQALLHDPEYLILDEPTDGLDPNQKAQIRELIKSISVRKAIILSTHILEEVEAVCNRVIIIDRGRIVVDTTPAELATLSKSHNAIFVQMDGLESDQLSAQLRSVVNCVEIDEVAHDSIRIVAEDRDAVIDRINEIAKASNCTVRQMYPQGGNLNDVFRQITQEN